jgi:putative heme-binding domain-containing protein
MPKNLAVELSPDAIRNIVAFLASCGAFPDYDEIARLEIPDRRSDQMEQVAVHREDMDLAMHVLQKKGSCLQCHALHSQPEYQALAPALFGVGLTDNVLVRQSVVDPNKSVAPVFRSVNVVLQTGKQLSGRMMSQTADRLVLLTYDSENQRFEQREIPMTEIEHEDGRPLILESKASMMPSGFAKSLTQEEIEAVITLIRQLN